VKRRFGSGSGRFVRWLLVVLLFASLTDICSMAQLEAVCKG
jgi:hypothetical protein